MLNVKTFFMILIVVVQAFETSYSKNQNNKKRPCTSLHEAIKNGNTKCLKQLIKAGNDINSKDKNGFPPIVIAAALGQKKCLEILIKAKADIDERVTHDASTALIHATKNGHKRCIKMLLKAGADTSTKDNNDKTAKEYAHNFAHKDCESLLAHAETTKNSKNSSNYALAILLLPIIAFAWAVSK